MSDAMEIGRTLVELCRTGRNMQAIETCYDDAIVSVEPVAMPQMPQVIEGKAAVLEKNRGWFAANEIHTASVDGPFPHGDRFVIVFHYDFTPKVGPFAGQRIQFGEAGLYTTRGGKVVKEEFFYTMQ